MAQLSPRTVDALRVYALSRIPRCQRCPRLIALRLAQKRSAATPATLPDVPQYCHHVVCAPLAERYVPPHGQERIAV